MIFNLALTVCCNNLSKFCLQTDYSKCTVLFSNKDMRDVLMLGSKLLLTG